MHHFPKLGAALPLTALLAAGLGATMALYRSAPVLPPAPTARTIALAPHHGAEPIDAEIAAAQQRAATVSGSREFEALGWLFVKKARLSNDPGYYQLAERCALTIEETTPDHEPALLLRGHALAAMHRFREAETLARSLIARREFVLDHALLGDALMEQGRVDEAVEAYQRMADLKPCLQAYTRIAHVRWLKGDLEGAIEMAEEAAGTGNGRDPEPLTWALTKLAAYRFESGDLARASATVDEALARIPDYAAAMLLRGRILLAQERPAEAVDALRIAAQRNPLPEPLWALADALRAADHEDEAAAVEARLEASGATADPRSFSLYLASRNRRPDEALQLARLELEARQDVFTHDALAWACFAAGRDEEALAHSRRALAEGTRDARLQLHAGLIAARCGEPGATALLEAAHATRHTLLSTERHALDQARSAPLSQR